MRVLLYYTSNRRSIAFETLLREYVQRGHEVHLLTTCEPGELHARVATFGVHATGYPVPRHRFYYARQIRHLATYCREKHIDAVLSQLQEANIIAVFAERLTDARFYMFRHHPRPYTRKERTADWIVNHLAKSIVVLTAAQKRLVLEEGVPEHRIHLLPLMYDFEQYCISDDSVRSLKATYPCALRVLMLSRLVHYKRHMLAFRAIEQLAARGSDVKLLVMDDGPEREKLEAYVRERSLQRHIYFIGYQSNVADYLEACDVLLQPSESEVSANAVKEAGVRSKIVIACRGVGDFDEYLEHMDNAVLLDVTDGPSVIADHLADIIENRTKYNAMAERLRQRVVEKFTRTASTMDRYLRLVEGTDGPVAARGGASARQ